jgi:hypothetical protein
VDTKCAFETAREAPKILADHDEYGRVLIVHKTGEKRWAKVRFDENGKPVLGDDSALSTPRDCDRAIGNILTTPRPKMLRRSRPPD